jgi:Tripartite tricarboxylate transporter family receptor
VLAVADEERVPQAKDVPTIGETLKGYTAHVWFGLMAPARTPEPIVTRLAAKLRAAVNLPDAKERLAGLGLPWTNSHHCVPIIGRGIPLLDVLRRRASGPDLSDRCVDDGLNRDLHGVSPWLIRG